MIDHCVGGECGAKCRNDNCVRLWQDINVQDGALKSNFTAKKVTCTCP